MSGANVALVRIAMEAYGNGAPEVLLGLADPLMRWDERAARADGELVWGKDAVERQIERRFDEWDDYELELEEIEAVGDAVVGVYTERGIRRATGVPVEEGHAAVWTIESGKIADWSVYLTKGEAMSAARHTTTTRFSETG